MNPRRVDFVVDLAYGVAILASIGLILVVGTEVGIAFGLGVIASYVNGDSGGRIRIHRVLEPPSTGGYRATARAEG
ncbi:hypothetical protein BRD00_05410 [Halobacteriales archaeon QS_8_69_26]|nr:MAG: hypothetical protein BRD00_05410 [Halobacteriales archaeon QS_8_69_26]